MLKSKSKKIEMEEKIASLFNSGKLQEAVALCKKLCASKPDASSWYMMGTIQNAMGLDNEAVQSLSKALKLRPNFVEAEYNLACVLMRLERDDEAKRAFQSVLNRRPIFPEALTNLGSLYKRSGDIQKSISCYEQAIRLNPGFALAHYNMGNAFYALFEYEKALNAYNNALALDPRNAMIHSNIGDCCKNLYMRQEAIDAYKAAIKLAPDHIDYYLKIADAYTIVGNYDDAKSHYLKVLQLEPTDTTARSGLALLADKIGNIEDAWRWLEPLHANNESDIRAAVTFSNICNKIDKSCDDAISWIKHVLSCNRQDDIAMVGGYFALGKLYDKKKMYQEAFNSYDQGNRLRLSYAGENNQARMLDEIKSNFSAEIFNANISSGSRDETPIFIVGMPRSGTSLVEQILASHPDVYGAGELEEINKLTRSLVQKGFAKQQYPFGVHELTQDALKKLADEYITYIRSLNRTSKYISDKMPHNFAALGFIQLILPNCKVIHCTRDPVDTCFSIYINADFNANHSYAFDLNTLGEYYIKYLNLMDYWKATLDIKIMDIQYEKLILNQEEETRRLIDFCGLEWNDQCLRFYQSERITKTPSYDQVRQPIYTSSIKRWENYRPYIKPLTEALKDLVVE